MIDFVRKRERAMSDEPIIDDLPTEDATPSSEKWVMPEPVFRTSDGHTPKSIESDLDGEDTDPNLDITDKDAADKPGSDIPDDVAVAITEEMPVYSPKAKRGYFRSFLFIFGMIALLAAAIIAALVYYLSHLRPTDTGTF